MQSPSLNAQRAAQKALQTLDPSSDSPRDFLILQDASTLVLKFEPDLIARVIVDPDGPRQGLTWFQKETDLTRFLSERACPVVQPHPSILPGPHEVDGFVMSFWKYLFPLDIDPDPFLSGKALEQCHRALREAPMAFEELGILHESLRLARNLPQEGICWKEIPILIHTLERGIELLQKAPMQAIHGDAHWGNVLNTSQGPIWMDWEDAFSGPIEWDLASLLWNTLLLEEDRTTADRFLEGYLSAGGCYQSELFNLCLTVRAAVIAAWYPHLYPNPDASRQHKLQARLDWIMAHPL